MGTDSARSTARRTPRLAARPDASPSVFGCRTKRAPPAKTGMNLLKCDTLKKKKEKKSV